MDGLRAAEPQPNRNAENEPQRPEERREETGKSTTEKSLTERCHFSVFSRSRVKEIWKLAVFFDIGQEFRATDAVFDDASGVFANG